MSRTHTDEYIQRFLRWSLFFTLLASLAPLSRRIDPFFIIHLETAGDFALSRKIALALIFERYDAYTIASKQFTVSQIQILNKNEAASQIDYALVECITRVR